ncbi:MAG: hypothetical protein WC782_12375 [Methylococcaceae bacterium]|jgi:hypothetical protein
MISTRYVIPTAVLLTAALIPTVIHNYLQLKIQDGRSATAISPIIGQYASLPSPRNQGWGEYTFESYDWFERDYGDSNGRQARLFVGRSFNHKRLYHHPELALSHGKDLRFENVVWLNWQNQKIPVTVLKDSAGVGLVAYTLVEGHQFIANPITYQISNSLNQLVNPAKPLTLFYVSDTRAAKSTVFEHSMAADILVGSISSFFAEN